MRQATTQGLYQYWNTVRNGRMAPRRYEIEPSQIVPFLSETMILEEPLDACRFRVAGTRVSETLGDNLRGNCFLDLWSAEDQLILRDNIRTIAKYGAVGLFSFEGQLVDEVSTAKFELLLLPLSHLEERIERLLGSMSLVVQPEWLSTALPTELRLTSNEIIWPDGRPHALSSRSLVPFPARGEVPILRNQSGIRRARLVRSERRNFLVYDGGRSDNPPSDDR